MAKNINGKIVEGDFVKLSKSRAFNAVINYAEFNENMALLKADKAYQVYIAVNDKDKRGENAEVCQQCPYRTQNCDFNMLILEDHHDLFWCNQFFDKVEKPEESDEEKDEDQE